MQITTKYEQKSTAATANGLRVIKSIVKLYLLCLALGGSLSAQQAPIAPNFPNAPSAAKTENVYLAPFKHAEFYVGVGVFSASAYADVHSTKVCERNLTCVEAYSGHDRYSYIAPLIGLVAAGTYGCELILHDHKWYRRFICPGIGIGMSIQHWQDASTVYHVDYRAR